MKKRSNLKNTLVAEAVSSAPELASPEVIISPELITEAEPEVLDAEVNVRVAILSEDGFEECELTSPKEALERAGAIVDIISTHTGKIKSWDKNHWGHEVTVDKDLSEAVPEDYDALILPGGVMNPDKLRQNKNAISFVKRFINAGKPVAAICHGPQTLIETGLIEGNTMTSYPSLQTDLRNAGVEWVDKEVVHCGQFITSRQPGDLEAFNRELLSELSLRAA
ncbi:MAG: type 1 glutamine amidotransferase domain-containing protein [Bacteroidota bacterium]